MSPYLYFARYYIHQKVFQFIAGKVTRIEETGTTTIDQAVKSNITSCPPALTGSVTKAVPVTRH